MTSTRNLCQVPGGGKPPQFPKNNPKRTPSELRSERKGMAWAANGEIGKTNCMGQLCGKSKTRRGVTAKQSFSRNGMEGYKFGAQREFRWLDASYGQYGRGQRYRLGERSAELEEGWDWYGMRDPYRKEREYVIMSDERRMGYAEDEDCDIFGELLEGAFRSSSAVVERVAKFFCWAFMKEDQERNNICR